MKYLLILSLFMWLTGVSLFAQLIPVVEGKKLGYINPNGDLAIPFDYTTEISYINLKYQGKTFKTFTIPTSAYFENGIATVQRENFLWFIYLSSDFLLINEKGSIVLDAGARNLGKYNCGLVPIATRNKVIDVYIEYYTYCDINGNLLDAPFNYAGTFYEDLAVVMNNGNYYHVNKFGSPINNLAFEHANRFSEGRAAFMTDKKWGYIDNTGIIIINPVFDLAWDFHDGMAKVLEGDRYGFIERSGNYAIRPRYFAANGFSEGLASVQHESGYWGYIDKAGEFKIKPEYISAGNFSSGLAPVDVNGKFGFIDTKGNLVINPQFDYAREFNNGIAEVWKDEKMFYMDKSGKIIWTFEIE
ncbi:MAG: WG repeat-containing protein [Candidatus Kapabacteria bacterium]|nr:WG repeat-containing protein [Candidatus Kapabacteria bacterium]